MKKENEKCIPTIDKCPYSIRERIIKLSYKDGFISYVRKNEPLYNRYHHGMGPINWIVVNICSSDKRFHKKQEKIKFSWNEIYYTCSGFEKCGFIKWFNDSCIKVKKILEKRKDYSIEEYLQISSFNDETTEKLKELFFDYCEKIESYKTHRHRYGFFEMKFKFVFGQYLAIKCMKDVECPYKPLVDLINIKCG